MLWKGINHLSSEAGLRRSSYPFESAPPPPHHHLRKWPVPGIRLADLSINNPSAGSYRVHDNSLRHTYFYMMFYFESNVAKKLPSVS